MTDLDLVARLAKEADKTATRFWSQSDLEDELIHSEWLAAFAALVAEECAKIAEEEYECDVSAGPAIRARFVHSPPAKEAT
jgi:predicted CoA-binding protein